jgi:hypothetical protein
MREWRECTLEALAEEITQMRHDCLDQGIDFGQVLNLSWQWYNSDTVEKILNTLERAK